MFNILYILIINFVFLKLTEGDNMNFTALRLFTEKKRTDTSVLLQVNELYQKPD